MASQPFSVSRLIDMLGAARSSDEKRLSSLGIFIGVDATADRELLACVRSCFTARRMDTVVAVRALEESRAEVPGARDAAVFVVGQQGERAASLAMYRAKLGIPCAIVCESSLDLPQLSSLEPAVASLITCIFATNTASLERKLARWLLNSTDKDIACAVSFPFCRPVLAGRMKMRCAAENALLGFTGMASGSDFTVMTANQLYLAFDLAAIYGDELTMQVVADMALVVLAATSARNAARLTDLVLPFGKRITRGAFAFAGTMAAARLVEARHDGTLQELAKAFGQRAREHVIARANSSSTSLALLS